MTRLRLLLRIAAFVGFFIGFLCFHMHDPDAAYFVASGCFVWLLSNDEVAS